MCESVGDFYDYLHEILDKHEANYNVEDGTVRLLKRGFLAKLRLGHPTVTLRRRLPWCLFPNNFSNE